MSSKNTFEIINDQIYIGRDGWDKMGVTTYREDYYDELKEVTWTRNRGYLVNNKLGSMHRYIMKKWYGEDVVRDMDAKGWVVDHMNNDGMDNRICNLEFLATRFNVAKGQVLDVESENMIDHIALNIFKDFSTGYYQISIGFNDIVSLVNKETGKAQEINEMYLLYNCDYRLVINDAEQILLDYSLEQKIQLDKLKCIDLLVTYTEFVTLTEEEAENINNGGCAILRDGKTYFLMGRGIKLVSAHYKEGWRPNDEE